MSEKPSRLVVSVDLDEWYHARWATGSSIARWRDPLDFYKEVYGTAAPRGDITPPTYEILDLLDIKGITATFFILGQVARDYSYLVREIAQRGHEIACHSYRHVDIWLHTKESFRSELRDAKRVLEDLSGVSVLGFRAPNLVIEDWMVSVLADEGFLYDSSVCSSRRLMGKFGKGRELPVVPYRLSGSSFSPGRGTMAEIPIPVFPIIRLPAATGIMTRIIGRWWSAAALRSALGKGDALYYFHPYEFTEIPHIAHLGSRNRLFSRRAGKWMKTAVGKLLDDFADVPKITCRALAEEILGNQIPRVRD